MKTLLFSLLILVSGCTAEQAANFSRAMNNYAAQENARIAAQNAAVANIYSNRTVYTQPTTTYGTITSPSGRMYQFNSTTY